jgi:6-phosphofructokinase 1
MLRLNKTDFENPFELAKYAATCGITLEQFRDQFHYLIDNDLLYKNIEEGKISLAAVESNEIYKRPDPTSTKNEDENEIVM